MAQATPRGKAQVASSVKDKVIVKYGPYGSKLPETSSMRKKDDETFKEVVIRHGSILDSIGFVAAKSNRDTTTTVFNQGMGQYESKISLTTGEKITKISGTYGNFNILPNKDIVIATLKIHTNVRPSGYGPYGLGKDVSNVSNFSSPDDIQGPIVGFFGRHNQYMESIGIYVEE